MHQTHLLLQISKNFVSGQNQPDARATNNYLTQILARERPDGTTIPISNFGRIEFQDGKRKQATQSYHGSGRPHLHRLEFVTKKRTQEDLQTFQLHNTIAASTTNLSQQMTKYVLASQIDWSCATPLPVIEEESRFDPDTNTYHIQHTIKDKKKMECAPSSHPSWRQPSPTKTCSETLMEKNTTLLTPPNMHPNSLILSTKNFSTTTLMPTA